jgi:ABC-2 type transport system permease protein
MKIGFGQLLAATFSTGLLALDFGTLALFLGCLRGNRGMSLGISAALAVATYFLNSLATMVETLKHYRFLSPFYHHVDPNPLLNGLSLEHTLVLAGLTAVLFLLSIPAFKRRDIGV